MSSRLRCWRSVSWRIALAISGSASVSGDMPGVLLPLDGGELLDAPSVASTRECRLEPDTYDFDRVLVAGDPGAQRENIGVVVLARQPCRVDTGARCGADSRHLVGGNR